MSTRPASTNDASGPDQPPTVPAPARAGAVAAAPHRIRRLSQLRPATWWGALLRSGKGFIKDNCPDLAAALTYWSLLGMFPAALVIVALVGLVVTSEEAVATLVEIAEELAPAQVASMLEDRVWEVVGQRTTAGVLLSFGVLGALWTASAYLRSFTRAANTIYQVEEGRPLWRLVPLQLGLTLVGLVLVATVVVGLVMGGPVARAVGDAIGLEETTIRIWELARIPALVLIAGLLLTVLFWVAPNVRPPRFKWLTVGGAVALLVWAAVSAGFGFYVANVGDYDVTYGALGTVIVFLVWLFLTNCAVLLGVEINAELQRGRRMQGGETIDPSAPPLSPRHPS